MSSSSWGSSTLRPGELAGSAADLLEQLAAESDAHRGPDLSQRLKHELFQCTVEVITGVCDTVDVARDDLEATLDVLRGDRRPGLGLIGSGTHPFTDWRT